VNSLFTTQKIDLNANIYGTYKLISCNCYVCIVFFQRLNARQVSACLHVLLWSPDEWTMNLNSDDRLKFSTPSELDLIRWLLLSTAQVLLEPLLHINRLEHELKVLFLSHLDFEELVESVHFL